MRYSFHAAKHEGVDKNLAIRYVCAGVRGGGGRDVVHQADILQMKCQYELARYSGRGTFPLGGGGGLSPLREILEVKYENNNSLAG